MRYSSAQEAPSASWGIVGLIPGLAPGASQGIQLANHKKSAEPNRIARPAP